MKKLAIFTMVFCCGILAYFALPKTVSIRVDAITAYMSLEEMVTKADLVAEVNVKSVSYTHLDVYKRQALYRLRRNENEAISNTLVYTAKVIFSTIVEMGSEALLDPCLLYTSRCV